MQSENKEFLIEMSLQHNSMNHEKQQQVLLFTSQLVNTSSTHSLRELDSTSDEKIKKLNDIKREKKERKIIFYSQVQMTHKVSI